MLKANLILLANTMTTDFQTFADIFTDNTSEKTILKKTDFEGKILHLDFTKLQIEFKQPSILNIR